MGRATRSLARRLAIIDHMAVGPRYSPFFHSYKEDLCVGEFEVVPSEPNYEQGRARVAVTHSPYPRLAIEGTGRWSMGSTDGFRSLRIGNEAVNQVVGKTSASSSGPSWTAKGFVAQPVNPDVRIGHLVANLYGFSHLLGDPVTFIKYPFHREEARRETFAFGRWRLSIDSLWPSQMDKEALEAGEYVLSHVCYVEKDDMKLFGGKQAFEICHFLELFLSLLEGAYVGPSLCAGRRQEDPFVWIWPGDILRPAAKRRQNWALSGFVEPIPDLIEPMWLAWRDPRTADLLMRAIPIYVEASRNDMPWDLRIATAQMGVEMMASHIVVERNHVMTLAEYEDLHTAGQIRTLLGQIGFDDRMPAGLAMTARSTKGTLSDAIADTRNAIVHPTTANRGWLRSIDGLALYHTWHVLLEILELSILYTIGYAGEYNSCLVTGAPSKVPWS